MEDHDDAPAPGALSDAERTLLRLMAAGVTDEAACKTLGWSRRTLRRHLRSAMDRVGAASRFQAGYIVGTKGLLGRHAPRGQSGQARGKESS